jgi:agmatine deiminase
LPERTSLSEYFDDKLTDTVFFTEALALRYPQVYWPMRINLEANGIAVKTVSKTRNIWIRDYFPIQVNGAFVRFRYSFQDKWRKHYPQLDISNEPWTGLIAPIHEYEISLDGGNIVQGAGKVILTDMVTKENGRSVVKKLEKIFQAEIIIIPIEPGDTLGHSDGICKIVNDKTILVNDYHSNYGDKLVKIFENHGFTVELFPYGFGDMPEMTDEQFRKVCPEGDDFNPAFGYYINFLTVKGLILVPVMKREKDAIAVSTLKRLYPNFNIVAIECSRLSLEGGLLGCVSANYKI